MKCEELLLQLSDYVDGEIDPIICEEFEQHLAGCNLCQVVVDNIRKTITLYREDGRQREIPAAFRAKLHATLRKHWLEKKPSSRSSA